MGQIKAPGSFNLAKINTYTGGSTLGSFFGGVHTPKKNAALQQLLSYWLIFFHNKKIDKNMLIQKGRMHKTRNT